MQKKKFFDVKTFLILAAIGIFAISMSFANDKSSFYIDGKLVEGHSSPMEYSEEMYFPLEPIVKSLDGTYKEKDEVAHVEIGDKEIKFPLDDWYIEVNGEKVALSTIIIGEIKFPGIERNFKLDDDFMVSRTFIKDFFDVEIKTMEAKGQIIYYIGKQPELFVEKDEEDKGTDSNTDNSSESNTNSNNNSGQSKNKGNSNNGNNNANNNGSNNDSNKGNNNSNNNSNNSSNNSSNKGGSGSKNTGSNNSGGNNSTPPKNDNSAPKQSGQTFDAGKIVNQLKNNGFRSFNSGEAFYNYNQNFGGDQIQVMITSSTSAIIWVNDWAPAKDDPDYDDLFFLMEVPSKARAMANALFPNNSSQFYNQIEAFATWKQQGSKTMTIAGRTVEFNKSDRYAPLHIVIK